MFQLELRYTSNSSPAPRTTLCVPTPCNTIIIHRTRHSGSTSAATRQRPARHSSTTLNQPQWGPVKPASHHSIILSVTLTEEV